VDLNFSSLCGAFFLLSIFSQELPATWSVSAFLGPAISCVTVSLCLFNLALDVTNLLHLHAIGQVMMKSIQTAEAVQEINMRSNSATARKDNLVEGQLSP
jgi:hypothetical protein